MATYNVGGFSLNRILWRPLALKIFLRIFYIVDRRPSLGRVLLSFLRLRPVWRIGQTVFVTGDRQVLEVLRRDDDFPLPEKRAEKFPTGAFVLGMSRTPQFVLERHELERVVNRADRARIEALVDCASGRQIAKTKEQGHLNVVSDLCTSVGQAVLESYFGLRNADELLDDLRLLGAMVASPHSEKERFRLCVDAAAYRVYVRINRDIDRVENGLSGQSQPKDDATVLERLVWNWKSGTSGFDREAVRRNITGVLLPGSALVARAFTTALVQLFRRKELRATAYAAREAGDRRALEGCLLEALRFHPVFPVVPRYCPRETSLPGFRREYRIKAGSSVFASVALAMFDGEAALFQGPGAGRPVDVQIRDRRHYRHFGGGAHECLGQHIALPQMAAMLHHLLGLPGLKVEHIRYQKDDGISPASLRVTFTPSSDERRRGTR